MSGSSFKRMIVAQALVALGVCVGASSHGEEALAPMAGTGGLMGDAERRVLGELPTKEAQPEVKAVAEQQTEAKARPGDERTIGEIAAVNAFGSREFAAEMGIADRLKAELADGMVKTVGDVNAAISKVQQELMKEGYYLLRISILREGSYDAETKTFSVLVDQGSFGRLNVKFDDGDDGRWFSSRQIYRRFKDIEEGRPFNYSLLRSALFDANSHPDLTIDIDVRAARKPMVGEDRDIRVASIADLDMTVHESCPIHAVWEVNNYGMEEVNEWQSSLTAQYLNLTKHDDVLTVSPGMSLGAEMFTLAASYMLPHEWWLGGNTTLYGGWSYLDVDDVVPQLDLEGTGYFVGLQHSENLYDDDRHQLAVSLGILWRYIEDQYTALGYALNERGASILPLSLAFSYTGKKADFLGGRNFATVQGVLNLVNGGDGLDEMWMGSEGNYWIARWQLARLQPLFGWFDAKTEKELHQWMLFLKLEGQYTSDTLIPVEKLALGGYNCLRGYRTRGYLGDYGIYGTVEIRTPILVDAFASLFGDRTESTPFDRLQFLGFCDYGIANYNDLPSGYDDNGFLCSFGVGARLALTKYSQLRCDLAFPIVDGDNADDSDCEFYLGAQIQF